MADSTIPNLVAVSVPALTDLLGVRQSGDSRDKKLTVTQLLSLASGGGDVTKVGTPVDDQIGIWTGDGTIEGVASLRYNSSLELFADSIVLGDLESVKIRETLVNTIAFRFSNFDRWRMNNDSFASSVSDGAFMKRTGVSGSVPSLVPRSGDENTGIGSAASDDISIIAGGIAAIKVTEAASAITIALVGTTRGTIANGFALINENASATNPTLIPNRADEDSGIGQNAADQVSIIGGGVELVRAQEAVGANQFIVSPGGIQDNAALPSLAFGDGDTGFYESFADTIRVTLAGTARWVFTGDRFVAHIGNGPSLQNEASTATNPTLIPALGDPSTGIGGVTGGLNVIVQSVNAMQFDEAGGVITIRAEGVVHGFLGTVAAPSYSFRLNSNTGMFSGGASSDSLLFSAGGVQALSLNELNSGVIQAHQANVAITAFATGGQASATQLDESYNVLSVVATTGDSVKLPPVFAIDSVMYIKNDGANAADVFPATGDDLGAGLNTAVSLAAGASISFIATVANATWTQWIVSAGGGGGDVTKVGTPVNDQIGVWTGDGTIEGDAQFLWDGSALTVGFTAAGPQLLNEVATDTNPTIVPTRNDPDTGIGHDAADRFALIAGGVTVAHVGETAGSPSLVIDPNDAGSGAVELAFGAGADTGFRESANVLTLVLGASSKWGWDADLFVAITATGAGLLNEAVSATNPTFVPNRSDLDSGIGQNAVDQVSIIGGGVELARAVESTGANQFIIAPGVVQNAALTPSLAFGDGNTGFFESADNVLKIAVGNAARWQFSANNFLAENAAGPFMFNTAGTSSSVPIMGPNRGDNNTGIGHGSDDQLDFICGGLNCITIRELGAARQIGFYNATPTSQQTGVAVTASAIHAALVTLGLITA